MNQPKQNMENFDLFGDPPCPAANLLPYGGIVNDYGIVFPPPQADGYFAELLNHIPWRHDEAVIYGKRITTARKVAWYGDDEKALGENTVIASVSFGAARKFAFKHKQTGEKRELMLQHGQLIVMRGETQTHWRHAVMKSTRITEPRINLTFRTMV